MSDYRYILKKYNGLGSRLECPHCHDKRSLVPYVDKETGEILDPSCGRCNHESGCGYHYKPSQYLRDNGWRDSPSCQQPQQMRRNAVVAHPIEKVDKPLDIIPLSVVKGIYNGCYQSNLEKWLLSIFKDEQKVKSVLALYCVCGLPDGRTVFWQFDEECRCRSGKVIQYKQNGHRVKIGDPEMIGSIEVGWIHSRLKREGVLPEDWTMSQCLFGEHLIPVFDTRRIGIVESEKTCLIMSIVEDSFLWLACGGLGQFSEQKMKCLEGREVVLFPDQGCHEKWQKVKDRLSKYCKCAVSKVLKDDNDPNHKSWDVADLIIDSIQNPTSSLPEPLRTLSRDYPIVVDLCNTFNLEIVA